VSPAASTAIAAERSTGPDVVMPPVTQSWANSRRTGAVPAGCVVLREDGRC
jgi:hypothetical protein